MPSSKSKKTNDKPNAPANKQSELKSQKKSTKRLASVHSKAKKTKKGNSALNEIPLQECPLNFSDPEKFLSSLLSPVCDLETFFNDYWEKKPLHIPFSTRQNETVDKKEDGSNLESYFKKLFNLEILEKIVESHELTYKVDINACKYDGTNREDYQAEGVVQLQDINNIFNLNKMTMQFHQPQRFHDELWKIQEKLESYFGCLVGSNIYMTPEGTQGLAPHYDDVEVFILQLGGCKDWKLYSPVQKLARECSRDLDKETMEKLDLIMELTMQPGDLMYFPRGTVHQAKVKEGCGMSTHITISTYQNHCWGDYLVTTLPHLIDRCTDQQSVLRRGLPLKYTDKVTTAEFSKQFLEILDAAKSAITKNLVECERSNTMASDFFANRLPPFKHKGEPTGEIPSQKSSIRFLHPDHMLISRGKGLYDDEDPLDEDDEELLDCDVNNNLTDNEDEMYIYFSTNNKRENHMRGDPVTKPSGLRFDISCMEPLKKLKESGNEFIEVEKLNPPVHLGLDMLIGLWAEGLIECKPAGK
uniref:Bifunctional lysine-specific demethylase and histidyl-hydroxylase n=1 Tax=Phallusia mammillata TaxID=59560 RepID=A0A6F9DRG9_9ASCI|nr:bifunctional lysine-specific demethylase and histidyl-hydroxylase MINA [Phallusia mammillata]